MLQRLLEERLRLRVHLEKKELPEYLLLMGKRSPTLHQAKARLINEDGSMEGSGVGGGRLNAKNETMQGLVGLLSIELHAPVFDQTGIKGEYDVVLSWGLNGITTGAASESADSIAVALQRETGLILKKQKAPRDFLVVDHVERMPVEN
jgi:uncharacterized protein (TIGR03435 family)